MNIHLVVTQLEPAGAQKVAVDLANGLGEKGHLVTVIFFFEKTPVNYDLHSNVKIEVLLNSGSFLNKLIFTFPELYRYWKKTSPDLCLSFTHYANIYSAIVGKFVNIPVIVSHHNERTTYNKIVQKVDQFLQVNGWYSGVVSVSQTTKKSFNKYYKPQIPHTVIYNSFEAENFSNDIVKNENVPLRILNIGRLMPQKNQKFLISSIEPDMNVELFIVGEGPERLGLEQMIKVKGLEKKVKLLGKKSHQEILNLLNQVDVFAMPSLFEGMSIALLEAIVSGIFTVVSDVPSQREAVSDQSEVYGDILPIDSPSTWNQYFRKLSYSKPGRLKDTDIHKKLVLRYSELVFIEKYEELFKETLK